MSHDIQAAWAASEVAELLDLNQNTFFEGWGTPDGWSVYAGRESVRAWPIADGVIFADNATHATVKMAIEYKRQNEGLHGVLTALGQSLAYLEKGYDASIIVIPESYVSHPRPGYHVKNIIESTIENPPISVYTYKPPDSSVAKPFSGKLNCEREIILPRCNPISTTRVSGATSSFSTLWAHVREGMSHPNAFYRYLQAVKLVSSDSNSQTGIPQIPQELCYAVSRLAPENNPENYLSHTTGDSLSDQAWRIVWFNYYFWEDMMPIFSSINPYCENLKETKIRMMNGEYQRLFDARNDSIKQKLVKALNDNEIDEDTAYEKYVIKVRSDAHSYREVIDSGLFHIGFLQEDGTLSELGYKYVDACERIDDANKGIPLEILRASALVGGQYDAFLYYIYQVSEERFSSDTFAFTETRQNGNRRFIQTDYKQWLYSVFSEDMHLIKTSTSRAGGSRKPFQSEIPFLRQLGFIKGENAPKYRIGVGLEIDWPQVQRSLAFYQSL